MQQLKLFETEITPPITPAAVIKVKTWEQSYQGYRGAFSIAGQRIRKGKIEFDYQCDIYDPDGFWITYVEVTGVSPKNMETDFKGAVDAHIRGQQELETNARAIVDFIRERSKSAPPSLPADEISQHFDPLIKPENRAKAIFHAVYKGWIKEGDLPHDPFKYVLLETQCIQNPDCHVLEQVNNDTVPELSTRNVLQWVEVYTPSKRKKNSYYRYCYKLNGKIHHSHIAGGNVKTPLAIARYEEIQEGIVRGMAPHQIKAIIASWKVDEKKL